MSFTCFPRLPAELRNAIWDAALDDWAVVSLGDSHAYFQPLVYYPALRPILVARSCQEAAARWRKLYPVIDPVDFGAPFWAEPRLYLDRTVLDIPGNCPSGAITEVYDKLTRYAARPTASRPAHVAISFYNNDDWKINRQTLVCFLRDHYNDLFETIETDPADTVSPFKTVILACVTHNDYFPRTYNLEPPRVLFDVLVDAMRQPCPSGHCMYTQQNIKLEMWCLSGVSLDVARRMFEDDEEDEVGPRCGRCAGCTPTNTELEFWEDEEDDDDDDD